MELLLLYPTDRLSKVNVTILTNRISQILGSAQELQSGQSQYSILESITKESLEDIKQLSIIDSLRILFTSWAMVHGTNKWTTKLKCPDLECGAWAGNLITHTTDAAVFKKSEIYDKPLVIDSVDEDGKPKQYSVQLEPLSVAFLEMIIVSDEEVTAKALSNLQIKSVNGDTDFGFLPFPVFTKIRAITSADNDQYQDSISASCECHNCGKHLESAIGFHHGAWLENNA